MTRYGQGNGPTRAKTLRMNRRLRQASLTVDERELRNRPGFDEVLGTVIDTSDPFGTRPTADDDRKKSAQ